MLAGTARDEDLNALGRRRQVQVVVDDVIAPRRRIDHLLRRDAGIVDLGILIKLLLHVGDRQAVALEGLGMFGAKRDDVWAAPRTMFTPVCDTVPAIVVRIAAPVVLA